MLPFNIHIFFNRLKKDYVSANAPMKITKLIEWVLKD